MTPLAADTPGRVTARLGAFRFGDGDRVACVYLDAPTPARAEESARLVLAVQNGVATFARSAPSCFMGDTAVKVQLRAIPGNKDVVLLDVSARLRPTHLTHAFVFRNRVPRADAEAFWALFQLARNYVLSVATAGVLDLGRLYVVKYHVEGGLRLPG